MGNDSDEPIEFSAEDIIKFLQAINNNIVKLNNNINTNIKNLNENLNQINKNLDNIKKLNIPISTAPKEIEEVPIVKPIIQNNKVTHPLTNSNDKITNISQPINNGNTTIPINQNNSIIPNNNTADYKKQFLQKKAELAKQQFPALQEPEWKGVDDSISLADVLKKG